MTTETTTKESPSKPAKQPRPGRGKKREKKRASLPKILLFLSMVLIVGLIAARLVIHFMLRPDAIVERLERQFNLRAEVEDTSLSLLSFPARLEIKGLALAPRDKHADNATPLGDRVVMAQPVLKIDSVVLEQGLTDLLFGTLDVQELKGDKFKLEFRMEEDGSHTLEGMFDKPEIVAAQPNPDYKPVDGEGGSQGKGDKGGKGVEEKKKRKKKSSGLMVDSLPLNTNLKDFILSNGEIVIHLRKKDSKLHFRDVDLSLGEVVIDRENLSEGNVGDLKMSGNLTIQKDDETETYAQLDVEISGKVVFFEKTSGKFNPEVNSQLILHKGSTIDNIPTIARLKEKLSPLSQFGIHLDQVNLEGMVQDDSIAQIRYFENEVTFQDQPRVSMADYTLDIYEGAWLRMDENTHFVKSEVRVSEVHTEKTMGSVYKYLGGTLGKLLPTDVKQRTKDYLLKDERLAVIFTSDQALSRPKVTVVKPDGDDLLKATGLNDLIDGIKGLLEDKEAQKKLKDALKGLFE